MTIEGDLNVGDRNAAHLLKKAPYFDNKENPLPSQTQVMLGSLHNLLIKSVCTLAKKVIKYCERINMILTSTTVAVQDIESLHGNLNLLWNLVTTFLWHLVALADRIAFVHLGVASWLRRQ